MGDVRLGLDWWVSEPASHDGEQTAFEAMAHKNAELVHLSGAIAHELKNPLTPIRMSASALARSDDPQVRESAEGPNRDEPSYFELCRLDDVHIDSLSDGCIQVNTDETTLGQAVFGGNQQARAVLVTQKDAVVATLVALG